MKKMEKSKSQTNEKANKRTVYLKFDDDISALAGFDYGRKVYREQANGEDFDEVVFPDQIELVAISFVQGFFSRMIEKYGAEYVRSHCRILSSNTELTKKIKDDIY